MKQIETRRLGVPKPPMILRIAEVLRVRDLADLTGDQSMSTPMFIGPRHARLPGVWDALNALPTDDVEAPQVEHLRARLMQAWQARHAAPNHREVVGGLLPIRYNGYARRIVLEETEARSPRRRRRAAELAT